MCEDGVVRSTRLTDYLTAGAIWFASHTSQVSGLDSPCLIESFCVRGVILLGFA